VYLANLKNSLLLGLTTNVLLHLLLALPSNNNAPDPELKSRQKNSPADETNISISNCIRCYMGCLLPVLPLVCVFDSNQELLSKQTDNVFYNLHTFQLITSGVTRGLRQGGQILMKGAH